jgi:hypothetical protein
VRRVPRPPAKVTDEQKRLLNKVNRAIDHRQQTIDREDEKVWAAVQELREAGMPDQQIVQRTGLNRSTLQTRLGPRPETVDSDKS